MKHLIKALILVFSFVSLEGFAQCNVKTNNRSDGVTVRYLNPEFVGSGAGCELGVSISTNGTDYFFNTAVRYASTSIKSIGMLMIGLDNNQSLNLKLYTCEMASVKNSEMALGVYLLSKTDIETLKKSPIGKIIFKESSGRNQIVILSKNYDVALRQIKCLDK